MSNFKCLVSKTLLASTIVLFLLILTGTTNTLYLRTTDHQVLIPENIITGKSQAPNQYRILTPLLYQTVNSLVCDSEKSDKIIIFLSILFAYSMSGTLFYKSSRSITTTLLGLLALLGCFSFGMMWKYRQEFFEVALVSSSLIALISVKKRKLLYLTLALIACAGSLNRETYIFCVTASAAHIIRNRIIVNKEKCFPHLIGIISLFLTFTICYILPRWYYGLSEYHCAFWTYKENIQNLSNVTSSYNLGHIGAGIFLAYLASTIQGNRQHIAFIVGYAIPLLGVSFFVSLFAEHRVFYPLITLLIASMLGFSSGKPFERPKSNKPHLNAVKKTKSPYSEQNGSPFP